eukprot:g1307.t1
MSTGSCLLVAAAACFSVAASAADGGSSFWISPAYPSDYDENLAALTLAGIVNRAGPTLWLNASSPAPGEGYVAVNWPYPQADQVWLDYLAETKGMTGKILKNSSICTLLQPFASSVKGLIMYEDAAQFNSLRFLAMTAGGLHDALPITAQLLQKHACLAKLPVTLRIPSAASFANDLAAYEWGIANLLPLTSKRTQGGACKRWTNYTCGSWADPLGTAALDYVVSERGFIHNLSPDTAQHPDQAALFTRIAAHMGSLGVFTGWAAPETSMVSILSKTDSVVQCGAPNLSFLSSAKAAATQLPYHRGTTSKVDPNKRYVVFQTNEGDTPKNAYGFRGGNWLSPNRGKVPISWGVSPIQAERFPLLWEYYVRTATPADQFFAATGGVGYTYPWALPDPDAYFKKAGDLYARFMPQPGNWVDLWEGGLNKSLYARYRSLANNTVDGFSQQPSTGHDSGVNDWLEDGTPLFLCDKRLWYPIDKHYCNLTSSLDTLSTCYSELITAVGDDHKAERPFFVLVYGENAKDAQNRFTLMIDIALAAIKKLVAADPRWEAVGTQDAAVLGRKAE